VKIRQETVEAVVKETSSKMNDPNYSAVLVGGFVQSQAMVTQFISAHDRELGGTEAIVGVIFHAALLGVVYSRAAGRAVKILSFDDLDAVAGGDALALLSERQPSVGDFIASNVDNAEARKILALIALAMDRATV
jgi:hypothetical protein